MVAMDRPWPRSSSRAPSCRCLTTNRVMPSAVTRISVAAARLSFAARLRGKSRIIDGPPTRSEELPRAAEEGLRQLELQPRRRRLVDDIGRLARRGDRDRGRRALQDLAREPATLGAEVHVIPL